MDMTGKQVRSDEVRRNLRDLLDVIEKHGMHVTILRYDKPAAVLVPVEWYGEARALMMDGDSMLVPLTRLTAAEQSAVARARELADAATTDARRVIVGSAPDADYVTVTVNALGLATYLLDKLVAALERLDGQAGSTP